MPFSRQKCVDILSIAPGHFDENIDVIGQGAGEEGAVGNGPVHFAYGKERLERDWCLSSG